MAPGSSDADASYAGANRWLRAGRRVRRSLRLAFLTGLFGGLLMALGWVYLYISTLDGYYEPKHAAINASLPRKQINSWWLHTLAYGDPKSPALLLVHDGPGGDMAQLEALQVLSDSFYVVLYDRRGTGLSERASHDTLEASRVFHPDSLVEELEGVRAAYGLPQPVIVAMGWGAALAIRYRQRYPDKVGGLVAVAPRNWQAGSPRSTAERGNRLLRWWQAQQAAFRMRHVNYKGDPDASFDQAYRTAYAQERAGCYVGLPDSVYRVGAVQAQAVWHHLADSTDTLRWPTVQRDGRKLAIQVVNAPCGLDTAAFEAVWAQYFPGDTVAYHVVSDTDRVSEAKTLRQFREAAQAAVARKRRALPPL